MPFAEPWRVAPFLKPWHDARDEFRDGSVPKLANLGRAARAGLRVPETAWAWAQALAEAGPRTFPDDPWRAAPPLPCVVRSGSPTEDGAATSNAGQFTSVVVRDAADFPAALAEVVAALPRE